MHAEVTHPEIVQCKQLRSYQQLWRCTCAVYTAINSIQQHAAWQLCQRPVLPKKPGNCRRCREPFSARRFSVCQAPEDPGLCTCVTPTSEVLLVAWDQASELQGAPPDSGFLSHPVQLLVASCMAPAFLLVLRRHALVLAPLHAQH